MVPTTGKVVESFGSWVQENTLHDKSAEDQQVGQVPDNVINLQEEREKRDAREEALEEAVPLVELEPTSELNSQK